MATGWSEVPTTATGWSEVSTGATVWSEVPTVASELVHTVHCRVDGVRAARVRSKCRPKTAEQAVKCLLFIATSEGCLTVSADA